MLPLPALAGEALVEQFADCAGRLSALREHQWLIDPPASDQTTAEFLAMADLVEAAVAGNPARVMHLRLEAKAAQRGLLMQASFGADPALSAAAARQADLLVSGCRSLLVGQ